MACVYQHWLCDHKIYLVCAWKSQYSCTKFSESGLVAQVWTLRKTWHDVIYFGGYQSAWSQWWVLSVQIFGFSPFFSRSCVLESVSALCFPGIFQSPWQRQAAQAARHREGQVLQPTGRGEDQRCWRCLCTDRISRCWFCKINIKKQVLFCSFLMFGAALVWNNPC